MSTFFRRHKGRGSYDLFSSYNHFLPGWGGVCLLALLYIVGAFLGAGASTGLTLISGADLVMKYGILIIYPLTFIPVLLYGSIMSRLDENRTTSVALDNKIKGCKTAALLAFTGVFATIAAAYVIEPVVLVLPEMPQHMKDQLEMLLEGMPFWATLLSVCIFAPLFEEWLCRGFVLRGLLQKTNPAVAIAASALFFAVIHGNIWQGVPAFAIGLILGYVYYKTGSLKLTMLMHCANNAVAAFASRTPALKDAETFMDVLSPWAYWSIYAACILIILCAVVVLRNSQPHQDCQACRHQ